MDRVHKDLSGRLEDVGARGEVLVKEQRTFEAAVMGSAES